MARSYDVVVPTIGRPSLARLLTALATCDGPPPARVVLVHDRPHGAELDLTAVPADLRARVTVVRGRAAGPAAARNDGWREATAEWVAFLDDDVLVPADWCRRLAADLEGLGPDVAGSQGRIRVPLPADRRPTDWARNVAGLERARWATADLAYRRRVLAGLGGFDERFPRAYREDADLGLRIVDAGWRIVTGERMVDHPVGSAPWTVSLAKQQGNVDDALMDRLHGPGWRERADAPRGRRRTHVATTVAWLAGAGAALAGRREVAAIGAAVGTGLTVDLAVRRIAPGPRTPREVAGLLATTAVLPPVATAWWLVGLVRARRLAPRRSPRPIDAVLFDRDATLVADVPYNGDPDLVAPLPGVRESVERLRRSGVRVGVVSNQSGVARGILDAVQVEAVNRRVDELLGPFDVMVWCEHGPADGCACRKPEPGMVLEAAARLGVAPDRCAVVGDIGADVEAARRAGARGVLVPTSVTLEAELEAAPEVVADLSTAVDRLLADVRRPSGVVG
ncbi:MAG TPA: HAD-IIIA family hydrolase [Aquihabitans sp.]|jgi:HAD superfamily hydrolase (TIGR01662 family)|nr:HAD-IIIA family hydrolase [Aquihabitans sp.]